MTDCVTNHPAARILVCEDQDGQTTDLAQNVEHLGHHVIAVASTAQEATCLAEVAKPDPILVNSKLWVEMDRMEAGFRIGTPDFENASEGDRNRSALSARFILTDWMYGESPSAGI